MENWESGRVKELEVNYSIMRKQLLAVREDLKQRTMAKKCKYGDTKRDNFCPGTKKMSLGKN